MIKTSLLENKYYDNALRKSLKTRWFPILIIGLVSLHLVFKFAEPKILDFVMGFFSPEPDKSTAFYQDFVRLILNEILWLAGFLVICCI
jgi:hypothetical protein